MPSTQQSHWAAYQPVMSKPKASRAVLSTNAAAAPAASSSTTTAVTSFNPLSSFNSASTPKKAMLVVAGVGAVVGIGLLVRRGLAKLAARRAIQAVQMPDPSACHYTQIRVEAGVGAAVPESYEAYLAAAKQARGLVPDANPWYVYVGASNNDEGVPWCPDCRKANPVVHAGLERAALLSAQPDSTVPGPIVVVTTFVDRAAYKDASNQHPLKSDKELHLPAVPTLFKFVHGAVIGRLVEDECFSEQNLDTFLQAPLPLHSALNQQ